MSARFIVGDSLTVLRSMPAASVDVVITSPPFLALRSYLPADHPDKALEVGSEATPADFIDVLLAHTAEWRRVLAPHGSICVELGDTYSGSGGAGGDYGADGFRAGQAKFTGSATNGRRSRAQDEALGILAPRSRPGPEGRDAIQGYPMDKSLCLIPELYRVALAYGLNPLTGAPSPAGRWRVRNVVRWHRPNPPVGALGDKFRPATSDMVIGCTSRTRYFDLDAVRGNPEDVKDQRPRTTNGPKNGAAPAEVLTANYTQRIPSHPGGAPPLDTWVIPTSPYRGSHYATFPPALITRPVLAMCPQRVCQECGEPSRRVAETSNAIGEAVGRRAWRESETDGIGTGHVGAITRSSSSAPSAERTTLGWTDCGHDAWRTGVVLDPFAGSGTTLAVATGHGRDAIGIDLDERNAHLAQERVGMFLDVEHHDPREAA